jgi:hypothetical protein
MTTYLPSPRNPLEPLILTDEQAELVLAWYTVDKAGKFPYRRCICERAKGWGKSPIHGAICLAELGAGSVNDSAPVLFDGWRGKEPIGRPWGTKGAPNAWVQIAAVSEDQTDNTYSALYEMLTANNHKAAIDLRIDDGKTRLYLKNRTGRLEPVTASAGSREGQPVTHGLLDETHLYLRRNGGVKLAATIRRNVAKMGGRTMETTNAPMLGEGSVAEQSGQAVDRGFSGILWDAKRPEFEPDPEWSDERLLSALVEAYGDSYWVDLPRILADVRDPATEWSDALRFFFNIRAAGQSKAIDPKLWDSRTADVEVPKGTYIGLGFDGSISGDATVLRGCTADGYSFLIDAWERPDGVEQWTVPRLEVHAKLEWAFSYYNVGRMMCDPPKWWTEIEQWEEKYGLDKQGDPRVLKIDTNSLRRFSQSIDRWMTMLREGSHTHDDDPITNAHVKATHKEKVRVNASDSDGRTMYKLTKGEGTERRRIDACIADVLALEAAMTMAPQKKPKPKLVVAMA